jgi:hypothetical protein
MVKYLVEGCWVRLDEYRGNVAEARKIGLFGIFCAAMTALFWVTERCCLYSLDTAEAKYIDTAIGPFLGNWIGCLRSNRYVFRPSMR